MPGAIEVLQQYDEWPDGKLDLVEFSRLVRRRNARGSAAAHTCRTSL